MLSLNQNNRLAPSTEVRAPKPPPADVRRVLDQLEGMFPKLQDRRMLPRWSYVAQAYIVAGDAVRELWVRDLNAYQAGFVSTAPVPTGTQGAFRFDLPNGGRYEIRARVMRCREFAPGCYEGYVNFSDALRDDVTALTHPD